MKSTKLLVIFTAVVFTVGLIGCGGGKYSDVKTVVQKFNKDAAKFIDAMDKADSAEKAAKAMNDFAEMMVDMKAGMEEFMKKYPELEDMESPPEELKAEADEMMSLFMKIMPAMGKAQQFQDDPAVQKAQEALAAAMK